MMLRIELSTLGAAMEDNVGPETVRILRKLADRIERDDVGAGDGGPLLDYNGNSIGSWIMEDD